MKELSVLAQNEIPPLALSSPNDFPTVLERRHMSLHHPSKPYQHKHFHRSFTVGPIRQVDVVGKSVAKRTSDVARCSAVCEALTQLFRDINTFSMDFFVEPDNIWVASSDGNLADVKKLISSGVDVNAQDEYGYSPL
jgi:hypothetical protein